MNATRSFDTIDPRPWLMISEPLQGLFYYHFAVWAPGMNKFFGEMVPSSSKNEVASRIELVRKGLVEAAKDPRWRVCVWTFESLTPMNQDQWQEHFAQEANLLPCNFYAAFSTIDIGVQIFANFEGNVTKDNESTYT